MTVGHVERLRRARDLLAVKGYDTSATKLACYSRAGFDVGLRDAARASRGCSCSGSTRCTAETGEVVTTDGLFVDLAVRGGRRRNTLRPARGRGVIFAGHNDLRAPVAQPDRAAAF